MQTIVVQRGARRGYAIPRILEEAGLLKRFYTDYCQNVGIGKCVSALANLPGCASIRRRLKRRVVPAEILTKTRSVLGAPFERCPELERMRWGKKLISLGLADADHLFTMLSEAGPFMHYARCHGLRVISEVYITVSTAEIMTRERDLYPEWEGRPQTTAEELRDITLKDHLFTDVDYYVCPSRKVQQDLINNWQIEPTRTALVPYGMSDDWLELPTDPSPGRILFVGTADLRKGIHYLAEAARGLMKRYPSWEFRIAGNVSDQIRTSTACSHLKFLGRLTRDEVQREYRKADVFVLPSLAEGSAEVTYEALACGLPVVVTESTGSVAVNNLHGFVVPERNSPALADAIEHLVTDRVLRDRFSKAAREHAVGFTWDRYGQRLISALLQFSSSN